MTSIWRSISYSRAARTKRKLLTFLTSALVPKLLRAFEAHADVGVAAQRTLLHVAVGDAAVEQDLLEARQVLEGLVRGADVGLGDDLGQRRAAAVQVEIGARGGVGKAVVEALAGVLFHVQAGDADALRSLPSAVGTSIQPCSARGLSNCEIW